jgi:ferredoxin hydrogenase small subunit
MRKEISRREFLKIAGITTVGLSFSEVLGVVEKAFAQEVITNFFETPVGKARLSLIKARQAGLYRDDKIVRRKFKIAASHENPMIKTFYKQFAKHPLSEISEELLHTHYKPRK